MCNTKMLNKTTTGGEPTLPKISFKILVKMDLVIFMKMYSGEYSMFQTRYKESNVIEISTKKCISEQKKNRRVLKIKEKISECKSAKHVFKFLRKSKFYKVFRT